MTDPRVSLVAFQDRQNGFIFVAIPDQRGRYLRTDRSVALLECPQCRALVGEPCRSMSGDGYSGTTHHVRRNRAKHLYPGWHVDDVLEVPSHVPDEFMEASA